MSGYEVVISALRKAGEAASSAGTQAAAVDLADALGSVAGALPGSRSAQAVAEVTHAWRGQVKGWSSEATTLGKNMTASADRYAANEADARQDLVVWYQVGVRPF